MLTTASCCRECTRCFCFASPSNFAFTWATGITIHINSCPVKCCRNVASPDLAGDNNCAPADQRRRLDWKSCQKVTSVWQTIPELSPLITTSTFIGSDLPTRGHYFRSPRYPAAISEKVRRKFRDRFFVLLRLQLVRGEEPCADGPVADSAICGNLLEAMALLPQLHNLCAFHQRFRAAKLLPVCPRIPNSGTDALPYQLALKLRHS